MLIGVSFFEKSLAWPRLLVIYSDATTYPERSTKMDARTNSILLQLKAKKEDKLDPYEKYTREQLEKLQEEIELKSRHIKAMEEDILRHQGAFSQTVDLYVAYVKSHEEKAK